MSATCPATQSRNEDGKPRAMAAVSWCVHTCTDLDFGERQLVTPAALVAKVLQLTHIKGFRVNRLTVLPSSIPSS